MAVQVDRARSMGIPLSHLDTHMGTLLGSPQFIDVYRRVARDYHLPIPLKRARSVDQVGLTPSESLVDEVVQITDEEAFEWAHRLHKEEGIFAGISSGGNMAAAAKVAARPENKGKMIVTVMCSFGERYLSTPLFEEE